MSHLTDEQLSLLIDGELSVGAREATTGHLRDCARCSTRLDGLVEVAAELRLSPSLQWAPELTAQVMRQLGAPAAGRVSTFVAAACAAVGAVLLALELPVIVGVAGVLGAGLAVAAAFLPSGVGVSGSVGVAGLLAIALVAPALAVRLARPRSDRPPSRTLAESGP